jgi:hypothetical protein
VEPYYLQRRDKFICKGIEVRSIFRVVNVCVRHRMGMLILESSCRLSEALDGKTDRTAFLVAVNAWPRNIIPVQS